VMWRREERLERELERIEKRELVKQLPVDQGTILVADTQEGGKS